MSETADESRGQRTKTKIEASVEAQETQKNTLNLNIAKQNAVPQMEETTLRKAKRKNVIVQSHHGLHEQYRTLGKMGEPHVMTKLP